MILGQISYLDCIVFLFFLIPQLLLNVDIFELVYCGVLTIPFLCKLSSPFCIKSPYKVSVVQAG